MLPQLRMFTRSIEEHRSLMRGIRPTFAAATDVSIIEYSDFIKIYVPKDIKEFSRRATVIYLPGTAFVAKETSVTDAICSVISSTSCCQVICLSHKLAPECKFPELHLHVYEQLQSILKNAEYYNIDLSKLVLSGYSSGGNIALLILRKFFEEGVEGIFKRLILICPILDLSKGLSEHDATFEESEKDSSLSKSFVSWFIRQYVPAKYNARSDAISPIFFGKDLLRHMPPTDLFVTNNDRFIDDDKLFLKNIREVGLSNLYLPFDGNHSKLWIDRGFSQIIGSRIKYIMQPKIAICDAFFLVSFKKGELQLQIPDLEKIKRDKGRSKLMQLKRKPT